MAVKTSRPRQNGRHFVNFSSKFILSNKSISTSINISLNFVPGGQINNISAVVQIMAWHRPGDKPLSEKKMINLLTHRCVTRPQWVKQQMLLAISPRATFLVLGKPHIGTNIRLPRCQWHNPEKIWVSTVECRYNAVRYYMTLHTSLQRLWPIVNDKLTTQKIPNAITQKNTTKRLPYLLRCSVRMYRPADIFDNGFGNGITLWMIYCGPVISNDITQIGKIVFVWSLAVSPATRYHTN